MPKASPPDPEREQSELLLALSRDPKASPAARVRALEVLERKAARLAGVQRAKDVPLEEQADPVDDMDELEAARRRRAARKAS